MFIEGWGDDAPPEFERCFMQAQSRTDAPKVQALVVCAGGGPEMANRLTQRTRGRRE